jgi:hypothetical protein
MVGPKLSVDDRACRQVVIDGVPHKAKPTTALVVFSGEVYTVDVEDLSVEEQGSVRYETIEGGSGYWCGRIPIRTVRHVFTLSGLFKEKVSL